MPKLNIEVDDYSLAPVYARQIWVGSAFAFVAPNSGEGEDSLQTGLNNFYGLGATPPRRTLALLPDGLVFPGFKVQAAARPLKLAPVLLPDKEIYRAGEDNVRLLLVAPRWLFETPGARTARLVVENNGATYRTQSVALSEGGLTLVELGKLPEGGYRVYWDGDEATDYAGDKAECRFSSVEYVLSPLQATLLAHELHEKRLSCRLKVERFNEPLNEPVQIELWSGNRRLGQERVKPGTPGIFNTEYKVKASATERLELRVSYLDQLATAVIPGSRKAERNETLLSGLGKSVQVSLMPRQGSRAVRGLYLNEDSTVTNTPVSLADPAPGNRKAILRWQLAAQAARVLVLDMHGGVIENRDLGDLTAGQEIEVDVPTPGGFVAMGAWLGEKAWEGWSVLLAPAKATLKIDAPTSARPGKEIELKLTTDVPASVYVLVRDTRLAGAGPQERLAASLKRGLEGVNKWATLGYVILTLDGHADWPPDDYYRGFRFKAAYGGGPIAPPVAMPLSAPAPAGRPRMQAQSTGMLFRREAQMEQRLAEYVGAGVEFGEDNTPIRAISLETKVGVGREGLENETAPTDPRRDFADVAFCGVVQTDRLGQATLALKLPDAITSYSIEAFSLSADGAEWAETRESLEVSQPLWAEFSLPAFVYPGDISPATLELGCKGGQFGLRLLCDGAPVAYTLSGAKQIAADTFEGHRAKLLFEAKPGLWRAELEDLKTQERDATERTVEAIGHFKGLARRFQLAVAGETISRSKLGALQMRLLPSLDKPFNILCDATTNYSHKCCEQTAAKMIAAVAALIAGGEQIKLREAILAGVAREKLMYLPGRGFTMYPPKESGGDMSPNEYWGKLAAEHLWSISLVGQPLLTPEAGNTAFDPEISRALQDAMAMGKDAAKAYKLKLVPKHIESGRDAYRAVATNAASRNAALDYARRTLQGYADNNGSTGAQGAVLAREEQAYCAAALLAGGDQSNMALAIGAANRLASSLDGDGRLYSTVDSVALISLMAALRAAGIGTGGQSDSRVRLDGREMALSEALEIAAAGQSEEISVLQGAALVELTSEITEDWNAFRAELPVSVQLVRPGKLNLRPLRVGDTLELVVKVERYEPGLLVHVCLPPALSRIEGGGEVKKFSVDFAGRNEVRLPLRATGATLPAGEHWAILVRNMFKEEQAGNPGIQVIKVGAD